MKITFLSCETCDFVSDVRTFFEKWVDEKDPAACPLGHGGTLQGLTIHRTYSEGAEEGEIVRDLVCIDFVSIDVANEEITFLEEE